MTAVDASLERRWLASLVEERSKLVLDCRIPVEDLALDEHQIFYGAVLRVATDRDFVAALDVRRYLDEHGLTKKAGGLEAVRTIVGAQRLRDVAGAAQELRRQGTLRRLREGLLRALAATEDGSLSDAVSTARDAVSAAEGAAETEAASDYSTSEAVQAAVSHYLSEERQGRPRVYVPVLSDALGQSPRGSLTVIGGYTGTGKSSLLLLIIEAYRSAGLRPGIVSLEDPVEIWGERILAAKTGVSLATIDREREGQPTRNELDSIQRGLGGLSTHPARWTCPSSYDLATVISAMRRHVVAHECGVVVVDYLQEITRRDMPGARRAEVMAQSAKDLKATAKRLGVPLVLASQLKRPDGKGGEPTVHDLKETGDLENVAEAVILLWKDGDGDGAPTYGKVAKAKSSPKRPRFQIVRNEGGAVEDLVYAEPRSKTAGGQW